MRSMVMFLMVCGLMGLAQADLAVTNGDFETGGGENITNVTDWFDSNTGGFWEDAWQTNASWITPNGTNVVVFCAWDTAEGDPLTGAYLYQSIGASAGESSVTIAFDWGAPNDAGAGRHDGLTISAFASDGTFVASDAVDIYGAAGVTLLDSASYDYVVLGTDGEIFPVVVTLDLSGANAGDEIFLRFNNYLPEAGADPWPVLDNVQILKTDMVTDHDPADGEIDVAVDLSDRTVANNLSWSAPTDPNIAEIKGYDLFLDPNGVKVANRDLSCLVAASTAGGVTQYDPANFAYLETYYWVVDTRYTRDDDPNLGTPDETVYVGSPEGVWSFTTISAAPVIKTYNSVVTTSALVPAALSAVVTDADGDLATAAFTLLTDDLDFPAGAAAALQNVNTANPYAPSVELQTDTAGTYKIRLAVSDGTTVVEDIAEVVVYDDACEAAQAAPSWTGFNPMDFDADCDVDLADLAAFTLQWLEDRDLAASETYAANPQYLPVINGIVNGNFELGNLTGFGWYSDGIGITDVDPIEGAYSVEWTVDGGDGIAYYVYLKPNTSYEWSARITGGANGVDDEFLVRRYVDIGNNIAQAAWTPTTPPAVQTVTVPFTTGPDEGEVGVDDRYELIIYSPTAGTYYKVDDWRLVEVMP